MNDLEQMAIERLKAASDMSLAAYQQPLVICISGGKRCWMLYKRNIRSFKRKKKYSERSYLELPPKLRRKN